MSGLWRKQLIHFPFVVSMSAVKLLFVKPITIMSPQARDTLIGIGKLFARYTAAITVGFFISPLVFLFVFFSLESISPDLDLCFWIPPAITGFVGVFASSLLIHRSSRWIASLFLLGLGLGCHAWFWRQMEYAISEEPRSSEFPYFIPLLCGGLVAVVINFICWLRVRPDMARKQTPES
jgi:hypothetical protein